MKQFYVYILSSPSEVLYIGMTNGLERRIARLDPLLVDARDLRPVARAKVAHLDAHRLRRERVLDQRLRGD